MSWDRWLCWVRGHTWTFAGGLTFCLACGKERRA